LVVDEKNHPNGREVKTRLNQGIGKRNRKSKSKNESKSASENEGIGRVIM